MNSSSKLKPINWGLFITIAIISLVILMSIFILLRITLADEIKIIVFGIIYLIFALGNLIAWLKTKYFVSFTLIMITLVLAISYLTDYKGIFVAIPLIILFPIYFYFVFNYSKQHSKYRQILELAAKPVDEKTDGFTARPFPVGETSYSKIELIEFARFSRKHLIALPYFEKAGVKLMLIDASRFWFGRSNLRKDTYVAFDFNGSIAVNIAKKEYQKYQDELTFDQLCTSFGKLFLRFFELFKRSEQDKIFEILDR